MGRAEAKVRGLPWATVMRWKRRLRSGLSIENGHGGMAKARIVAALGGPCPPQASRNLFGPSLSHPNCGTRGSDLTDKKVRWKVGANELEVEGESEFVDAQLARFFSILESRGSQTETASTPVQLRPSPINVESSARQARDLSPAEYIRQKTPDSGTAQLVVLAKYLDVSLALYKPPSTPGN
jgi:hypothetical protein